MLPTFVQILALSFFLPQEFSFSLFGLQLLPYRVLLMLFVIPAILELQSARKLNVYDLAMAAFAVPVIASMMYNHGFSSGLASGGVTALEITGSYFVARAYLNSLTKLKQFVDAWIIVAAIVFPFVLAEALMKTYLIHPFIVSLTGLHYAVATISDTASLNALSRFGLLRAMGPFSHPILCGVAYAAFVPYALLAYRGAKRIASLVVLIGGVVATVSSTALMMVPIALGICLAMILAARRQWLTPVRSHADLVLWDDEHVGPSIARQWIQ
jgi:hypothetical protein